jgi:hypothetical protein
VRANFLEGQKWVPTSIYSKEKGYQLLKIHVGRNASYSSFSGLLKTAIKMVAMERVFPLWKFSHFFSPLRISLSVQEMWVERT